MSEHTKGPWYVTPIYMPYDYEDAYGGEPVCWRVTDVEYWHEMVECNFDLQVDSSEADARLIAAAPELLEALQEINLEFGGQLPRKYSDKIGAAIAKARGTDE